MEHLGDVFIEGADFEGAIDNFPESGGLLDEADGLASEGMVEVDETTFPLDLAVGSDPADGDITFIGGRSDGRGIESE